MLRAILGLLAGLAAAWLTITLFEFASVAAYPPPPGLDPRDPQQLQALIAHAPPLAMALVLAGWVCAAFFGGLVAAWIAHRRVWPALVIGVCVLAGVAGMAWLIPHPTWMTLCGVLLPVPAAWMGARVLRRRLANI